MTEQILEVAPSPLEEAPAPHVSRIGLWVLTTLLAGSYMVFQLAPMIPVLLWLKDTGQISSREDMLDSEIALSAAVIALGFGSLMTILVAIAWPGLWHRLTHQEKLPFADWLDWRDQRVLPNWVVALSTPVVLGAIVAGVGLLFPNPEANLQEKLFQTDLSRILAVLIAPTVVPVAEELIFRGALYNALTPFREGLSGWQRHILPVTVTSLFFAAIHAVGGVDTLAGMLQIAILSFYLGILRAVTGSVKTTITAHVSWNLLAALAAAALSTAT